MVFFHKNQSEIVLFKKPKFRPDDVIISFVRGDQGLYYLEEYGNGCTETDQILKHRACSYSAVRH